jgi:YesN/AraC family two-component response regulator
MKCFEYNKNRKSKCNKKNCRYWINFKSSQNCCINAIKEHETEKFTLQDIGDIFKVTRMRICQIEKIAMKKVKERVLDKLA